MHLIYKKLLIITYFYNRCVCIYLYLYIATMKSTIYICDIKKIINLLL